MLANKQAEARQTIADPAVTAQGDLSNLCHPSKKKSHNIVAGQHSRIELTSTETNGKFEILSMKLLCESGRGRTIFSLEPVVDLCNRRQRGHILLQSLLSAPPDSERVSIIQGLFSLLVPNPKDRLQDLEIEIPNGTILENEVQSLKLTQVVAPLTLLDLCEGQQRVTLLIEEHPSRDHSGKCAITYLNSKGTIKDSIVVFDSGAVFPSKLTATYSSRIQSGHTKHIEDLILTCRNAGIDELYERLLKGMTADPAAANISRTAQEAAYILLNKLMQTSVSKSPPTETLQILKCGVAIAEDKNGEQAMFDQAENIQIFAAGRFGSAVNTATLSWPDSRLTKDNLTRSQALLTIGQMLFDCERPPITGDEIISYMLDTEVVKITYDVPTQHLPNKIWAAFSESRNATDKMLADAVVATGAASDLFPQLTADKTLTIKGLLSGVIPFYIYLRNRPAHDFSIMEVLLNDSGVGNLRFLNRLGESILIAISDEEGGWLRFNRFREIYLEHGKDFLRMLKSRCENKKTKIFSINGNISEPVLVTASSLVKKLEGIAGWQEARSGGHEIALRPNYVRPTKCDAIDLFLIPPAFANLEKPPYMVIRVGYNAVHFITFTDGSRNFLGMKTAHEISEHSPRISATELLDKLFYVAANTAPERFCSALKDVAKSFHIGCEKVLLSSRSLDLFPGKGILTRIRSGIDNFLFGE